MAVEIERKFLVRDDGWRGQAEDRRYFQQAYLNRPGRCSVRVRVAGQAAWLSVKSATREIRRLEFEYAIPLPDAEQMLGTLHEDSVIEKVRYRVPYAGTVWELDSFEGANAGLVIAEVELSREDQPFEHPPWLGQEVSRVARYFNASLAIHPYRDWTEEERRGPTASESA